MPGCQALNSISRNVLNTPPAVVLLKGASDGGFWSQSRLVLAFVGTVGVSEAGSGGQGGQGRCISAAILAGVFGFFATFVEGVLPLVRPGRVTQAGAAGKGADGRGAAAAVFAVVG